MGKRRQKQSVWPIALVVLGLFLILGSAVWLFLLQQSEAEGVGASQEANASSARIPYPEITRVSLADAYAAYQTSAAVFVDVRGEPYYSEQHISGALSIPEDELQGSMDAFDPVQWIIPYCT